MKQTDNHLVIVYPDSHFLNLDYNSGGYPYKTHFLGNAWVLPDTEQNRQEMLKIISMFPKDDLKLKKFSLILTDA